MGIGYWMGGVPVSLVTHSNANATICGKNASEWTDSVQHLTTAGLSTTSTARAATGSGPPRVGAWRAAAGRWVS